MNPPYSLGIIGAGMYGKVLMRAFQTDPRARLTWVCSASQATTQEAARVFNVPHATLDYHEILADPTVDAVVIATPPYLHARILEDALAARKHVLVEKPLAAMPDDTRRMVAAVASAPNLVVLEASCRHTRLQPKFAFIRDLIRSGKLGTVYHIHHNHLVRTTFIEWNRNGAWAMDKKLAGGGPFIDWGVYDLSFHLGLLDDVPKLRSLRSFTTNGLRDMSRLTPFSDIEQHGAAWMEFDTGLTYYYERGAGVHGETACETRLYGTKGGLRFEYPSWNSHTVEFFHDDGEPRRELLEVDVTGAPDDNVALAQHFLDCLDRKVEPMMTVARAARHLDILFRILAPENFHAPGA